MDFKKGYMIRASGGEELFIPEVEAIRFASMVFAGPARHSYGDQEPLVIQNTPLVEEAPQIDSQGQKTTTQPEANPKPPEPKKERESDDQMMTRLFHRYDSLTLGARISKIISSMVQRKRMTAAEVRSELVRLGLIEEKDSDGRRSSTGALIAPKRPQPPSDLQKPLSIESRLGLPGGLVANLIAYAAMTPEKDFRIEAVRNIAGGLMNREQILQFFAQGQTIQRIHTAKSFTDGRMVAKYLEGIQVVHDRMMGNTQ